MKKFIVIILLSTATVFAYAQKTVDKIITKQEVERIIKTLSDDDMQGRGNFTPGLENAAQFIESEYKKAGLKPMEGDSGLRQNFSLVRTSPVKTEVVINGVSISPDNIASAAGMSFKWTKSGDADVVVVTPDKEFREQYTTAIKSGKNLLMLVDPKFEASFGRIKSRYKDGDVKPKDKAAGGQAVIFVLGKFDAIKSFSVNYEVKSVELPIFNVVGILPGKTKPNEYVIFSGHYDHLGIIQPMNGDSIANGADDDASGTTAVISLAKYYAKLHNNARTLIFAAFAGEELGELGSQYFSKTVDPEKVTAMFNIEMIGKPSRFGRNTAYITGFEMSDFASILQKNLNGKATFEFYPDPYTSEQLFYRSDNKYLAALGVPAHTISTDQIDGDNYYHTVKDELSTLNVTNITAIIRVIALSSRTIVAGKDTPTRIPKLAE
jgi:hypothetical protein